MSVLDRFAKPIPDDARTLGERLLANGQVDLHSRSEGSVRASIFDNHQRLETSVHWMPGRPWHSSCSCAAFRARGICHHVVATALAAHRDGLIPHEAFSPRETRPRRGDRAPIFLSSTGQIRRLDEVDEPRPRIVHQPSPPNWKKQLAKLKESVSASQVEPPTPLWPSDRQLLYVIDVPASIDARGLVIRLACRDRRAAGEWSRPKTRGISFPDVPDLPDPADQQAIALLKSGASRHEAGVEYDPAYRVPEALQPLIVQMISRTGRALIAPEADSDEVKSLTWDDAPPWEFFLESRRDETAGQYVFSGSLRRGEERVSVTRPLMITSGGLVFFPQTVGTIADPSIHPWVQLLRSQRTVTAPLAQSDELLGEMLSLPNIPKLDFPDELRVEYVRPKPQPRLRIRAPGQDEYRPERLRAELSFDYDGRIIREAHSTASVFEPGRRRLIVRDPAAERVAGQRLRHLGLRYAGDYSRGGREYWFNHRHLPRLIRILIAEGWAVEADGKLYRRPGAVRLAVSSGIDWFELRGEVSFGDRTAQLPQLLSAVRAGRTTVQLDDGTVGILPESWLKKYGLLASVGTQEEGFLKFTAAQIGLLDALLASQPEATCDEAFEKLRSNLRRFDGVEAKPAPSSFQGELRHYQCEGLGWFDFLRRFHFGGCLADDMGLGKTVQVLALLASRHPSPPANLAMSEGDATDARPVPSLVVVPKSLVFNWEQEAARFAPHLRILDHTGIDRLKTTAHLSDYDVVLTTYGTLRRDAAFLKDVEFDYVILDEAQAVKNPGSESAKAVRLVNGKHRLALSGTPVQNHLGDLWSLFDFLNPGMMGSASVFSNSTSTLRNPDDETRTLLARALRPFILRRTKEQVASELPARLEQTIYCELEPAQRKLYDDLREHYRRALLQQVDQEGLGKSKLQILEALLRLRQAALHPGLIDKARANEPSAKLDVLLPQLAEVIEEGHKALVFSQFTSMLALLRERLDKEGVPYEYLDGKTKDREQRVTHFQSDQSCKLFLISLKAGGLGLNLTAADYVFLLDPWWNPAVEAQAIDRAHRIGQTKQVYACRLIAKDTVEEKVLALQNSKKSLADAIITADNSLLRSLGRDDLELLLS